MKKLFIPLLIFLTVLVFVIYTMARNGTSPGNQTAIPTLSITPTPLLPLLFAGVYPGETTESQVTAQKGPPVRSEKSNNGKTLVYKSGVGAEPVSIDIDSSGLVFKTIEPIPPSIKLDYLLSKYGQPEAVFYGAFETQGFMLFTYLRRGVAILGNPKTQEAYYYWSFKPTDSSSFLSTVAPGYSDSFSEGKQ